jgi:hypothetical protein
MLRLVRRAASRRALAVAGAAAIVLGCGSSKLVSQWRDPQSSGPPLRNVLVIAVKNDPVRRRIWEDAFTGAIGERGAKVTPSHQLFPNALPDTAAVVAKVRESGYDGVIVVRTTGRDSQTRYVPPTTTLEPVTRWDRFSNTYVTYYREVTTPGYVESQRVVGSEVSVWRTGDGGRLVWSGLTETVDPSSPGDFSKELSKLIVPRLVEAGIL